MAALLGANLARAGCPSAIYAGVVGLPNPPALKRQFFAVSHSKSGWTRVPFDMVPLKHQPVESQAGLLFSPQPLSATHFMVDFQEAWWKRPMISDADTIVVPDFLGGQRASPRELRDYAKRFTCARTWELEQIGIGFAGESQKRFLYLLQCPRPPEGQGNVLAGEAAPLFNSKALTVESSSFRYQMNRGNQMLFDRLEAVGESRGMEVFLEDGNFDIRADFKNFFGMHFTSDNVRSKIVADRTGVAAAVARLNFDLQVLFLQLDLQLNTDLLFFRDAVFLPMIMRIPRDAWRYVHPGSGVLYSWFPAPGTTMQQAWVDMPRRRKFKTKGDVKVESEQVIKRHCQSDGRCRFRAAVGRGPDSRVVLMEITVNQRMVESGFFPQYVADARSEAAELGWSWKGSKSDRPREGIYFELSQMAKGDHGFEIWLRLLPFDGDPAATTNCPSETAVREVVLN